MNPADLSKAILEVHNARDFADLPRSMIHAAARLLDFDAAGYNEFDTQDDQVRIYHTCGETAVKLLPTFNAHLHEHPTYPVIKGEGLPETPVRWSDFVTLREFRQTALYHEFFKPIGTNFQMGIGLIRSSRFVVSLSFNRQSRDFSEADRAKLTLLAPHFVQAFSQQKDRVELQHALRLHKAATGAEALAVVDSRGRIVVTDDHVHALLSKYFRRSGNGVLPDPLQRWLLDVNARKAPFHARGPCGELRILPPRTIPKDVVAGLAIVDAPGYQWLLPMVEIADAECTEKLRALGLTHREAQVLRWIGDGKRNSEIAAILGLRTRTVEKHCEHIFEKLGLESRGAACALASRIS